MGQPDIIYEDNDIIVCYKPAGIATQTRRIGQQDMESFIRNYRAAKNEPPYVGIVHRLDQPVEGVMVFAKNQKAAASLSRQIKEHTTEKYYRAASRGHPLPCRRMVKNKLVGAKCKLLPHTATGASGFASRS